MVRVSAVKRTAPWTSGPGETLQHGLAAILFNARQHRWIDHLTLHLETILIAIGRTTARVLGMNEDMRQMLRYEHWRESLY